MTLFWRRLERFSPILCRLLARHHYGPPLTTEEIAERSGLTVLEVTLFSERLTWHSIDVYQMRRFTMACGLDLFDRISLKRKENYLLGVTVKGKRLPPSFRYLRKSPEWESYFKPLLIKWYEHAKIH